MFSKRLIALAAVPLILCVACASADEVTTGLDVAVDAAIAAAPAIESAAGVSASVQAIVEAALSNAETCLSAAQTILSGVTSVTAQEALSITHACTAASATTAFPAGTPAQIVSLVNAATGAIAAFLKSLPASATRLLLAPDLVNAWNGNGKTSVKLSQSKLRAIAGKLATLHRKIHPAK